MPTVPKPRLSVDPQRALPSVELTTPRGTYATEGGEMGEAMQRVGLQATQLGMQLVQQQIIRKRQILQLETNTQLDQLSELTLHAPQYTDPATGEKTGGGILLQEGKAPYEQTQKYLEQFDLQAGEIAKAAHTADEKLLVSSLIAQRRGQVLNQINSHANSELRKYEWNLTQATVASTVNRMALHADQPEARTEAIAELDRALRTHLPRFGISGPVLEQTIDQAKAKGHEAVVKQLIQDDKYGAAAKYWESVKHTVQDADARQSIQERVDDGTTDQKAFAVVDEVMATLMPTDDQRPIPVDAIEKAIYDRLGKSDSKAYERAKQEWRSRLGGVEAGRAARLAQFENPLLDAILDQASGAAIRSMPEWRDATPASRYRIGTLIDQRDARREAQREAAISRGREDERWRIQELERAEASKFAIEAQQTTLAEMDENAMLKKALEFQTERYQLLFRSAWLEVQRAKNGGSAGVALNDDDARGVFASSGYTWAAEGTPTQWGSGSTGDTRRALYAQVVAAARVEIGRQEAGGKKLTIEEKNTIVKQILDTKVVVQGMFSPSEQVAVAVDPSDRTRAFVPLDKIPEKHLAAAIAWFRANTPEGRAPSNARLTDPQLARKFKSRFENSYAAMVMNLGTDAQFTELRRDRNRR
jgi:hypothetical protein